MTDYEYILKQARKFHYSKWTDEELRKCVDMLPNLSREELTALTENPAGKHLQYHVCRQDRNT